MQRKYRIGNLKAAGILDIAQGEALQKERGIGSQTEICSLAAVQPNS